MVYSMEDLYSKFNNAAQAGDDEAARMFKKAIQEEQKNVASYTAEDGGFRFDNLHKNRQYNQDLKDGYKARTGEDWTGSDEDLKEDNFEFFNSTFNNSLSMVHTFKTFSEMTDEQKEVQNRLFDTYEKTNITGEGKRPLWEQFKDAGDVLWDPTTYVGGTFIKMGSKAAAKQGLKKLLTGVTGRTAAVGTAVGSGYDVGAQAVEMEIDPDQEYDLGRTAMVAGAGGVLGAAAPAAIKGIAKVSRPVGSAISGVVAPIVKAPTNAFKGFIQGIGGAKSAQEGIMDAVERGIPGGDKTGAATKYQETLKTLIDDSNAVFGERYANLGEIGIKPKEINKFLDGVTKRVGKVSDLDTIKDLLRKGELTPSQALREIRSTLGGLANDARSSGSKFSSARRTLKALNKDVRTMFGNAASKVGKGEEASLLDKDYSEFIKASTDPSTKKSLGLESDAGKQLEASFKSGNPLLVKEFLDKIDVLARSAGSEEAAGKIRQATQASLAEHLFATTGRGAPLKRMLSNPSGIKSLTEVFGEAFNKKQWEDFAYILEAAHSTDDSGSMIVKGIVAGLGYKAGGALGALGALPLFRKLLGSERFKKIAMNSFSKNPKKRELGTKMVNKLLRSQATPAEIKEVTDAMTGVAVLSTLTYQAKDTSPEEVQKEVTSKMKHLYPEMMEYF